MKQNHEVPLKQIDSGKLFGDCPFYTVRDQTVPDVAVWPDLIDLLSLLHSHFCSWQRNDVGTKSQTDLQQRSTESKLQTLLQTFLQTFHWAIHETIRHIWENQSWVTVLPAAACAAAAAERRRCGNVKVIQIVMCLKLDPAWSLEPVPKSFLKSVSQVKDFHSSTNSCA